MSESYEQGYDEGYRAGLQAARDHMDKLAKESLLNSIKDVFRVSSPSKEMNKNQKQSLDAFFKAMNDNKEVGVECAYTCSECGEILVCFDFEQDPPKPIGYCPNCGSKVVE